MENLDDEFWEGCGNSNFAVNNNLNENCGSNSGIYNPQVSNELKPKKGQQFDTYLLTMYFT